MQDEQMRARVIAALTKVPPDILDVIDARGLRYAENNKIRGPSAIVIPKSGDLRPTIEVRATDSESAKRFSSAYELMRWVIGHERIVEQSKSRKSPGEAQKPVRHDTASFEARGETDASTGIPVTRLMRLAANLLLPKETLPRVLADNGHDPAIVAQLFVTNEEAVILRMRALQKR